MHRAVVNRLQPRPQPGIEIGQIVDAPGIEFSQKLVATGAVPALELTLPLWGVGAAVNQVDAQPGADALQGAGAVGGAIVDNEFDG